MGTAGKGQSESGDPGSKQAVAVARTAKSYFLMSIEQVFLLGILMMVVLLAGLDLHMDFTHKAPTSHIAVDILLTTVAIVSVLFVWRRFAKTQKRVDSELSRSHQMVVETAEELSIWRAKAERMNQGLVHEIEKQLEAWRMSAAEKEIGFLLLKGFSVKEIAEVRQTSERTVRNQTLAIYAKANLAGRAEFAAFFLEDLLDSRS